MAEKKAPGRADKDGEAKRRKRKAPGGAVGKGGVNPAPVADNHTVRVSAEQLTMVPISELVPYVNNAKIHSEKQIGQLRASLREFGFVTPVLIDFDNNIIAGHGRVEAARAEGMDEVPCVLVSSLTEAQRKAYVLADNRLAETASWDPELLELELQSLEAMGFDTAVIGFELEDLKEIHVGEYTRAAPGQGGGEVSEDDYDEEPPEEPRSKPGDIYRLGRHRLMCGDCTNHDTVKALLDGKVCELTFTDPPCEIGSPGSGIVGTSNSMKQIKQNKVDSFSPECLILYSETNIYFHNKPLIKSYIELAEREGKPYDLCFYKKLCAVPNYKGHMMTDVEYIAIIGRQAPNPGLDLETYSKCYIGEKDRDNDLSYSKPVALCAKYIQLYSTKTVFDPFGGSGSTLIACEQLGRTCYMMEISPKFVDVIIDRWEKFTGQKAEKIN